MAIVTNTDPYNMSSFLLDLQKGFIEEESSQTLALGTYGFMNAVASKMLSDSIIMAAEMNNEVFPNKAKLEKNIITHAISNNITDINAVPAKIDIMLCIMEQNLIDVMAETNKDTLIIDKYHPFFLGEYEYHLDYDIILTKQVIHNNNSVYTAVYDMSIKNRLSDIDVPYIVSPFVMKDNGTDKFIFISCHLRQVEQKIIPDRILTNDIIDNKTAIFEFENQLADFDVFITDTLTGSRIHLIPLFEGTNTMNYTNYCWYSYIDGTTIRIRFDIESYMPKLNSEIEIDLKTTHGSTCNFDFNQTINTTLENTDRFIYNSMRTNIIPTSSSDGGQDRISISELRNIIPKESLSSGSLTTAADLNNYFNTLNTGTARLHFIEKVHNQFDRAFYSYFLSKDILGNIIPTNTIDLLLAEEDFTTISDPDNPLIRKYILNPGICIGYEQVDGAWYGKLIDPSTRGNYKFSYNIPFKCIIHHNGPFVSYYMNMMNDKYKLLFSHINHNTPLQFISTTVNWTRSANIDKDKYFLNMLLTQNIALENMGVRIWEEDGEIQTSMKVIGILYDKDDAPYRYIEAKFIAEEDFSYQFRFEFITNDIMDENNNIRIDNLKLINSDSPNFNYGYLPQNTNMRIFVLNAFLENDIIASLPEGESGSYIHYGREEIDLYVPGLDDYSVTNIYTIMNGINFFDNYSEMVSTTIVPTTIERNGESIPGFKLSGVPVVRYSYSIKESNMVKFLNTIKIRKKYLDEAMLILENQFGIDFKFFNTYGPSRLYTYDEVVIIDRVNISINFKLQLKKSSDDYTVTYIEKFIKEYIEKMDNLFTNIHIPTLISSIYEKYGNSIVYIEFLGYNEYGTGIQHLFHGTLNRKVAPEFININMRNDGSPDINIKVV